MGKVSNAGMAKYSLELADLLLDQVWEWDANTYMEWMYHRKRNDGWSPQCKLRRLNKEHDHRDWSLSKGTDKNRINPHWSYNQSKCVLPEGHEGQRHLMNCSKCKFTWWYTLIDIETVESLRGKGYVPLDERSKI